VEFRVVPSRPRTLCILDALCAVWLLSAHAVHADSFGTGVFVRTDSDHTVVVSPRIHLNQSITEDTKVDLTYAADVWTSASVDIRASASLPVTEQRDELDVGVTHAFEDLTVSAGYRYSIENDYVSYGATGSASVDLAQHNSTLAIAGYLFGDTVGRSGAPQIARRLVTAGARLSFTQVLGAATLAQLTYEFGQLDGYQASPYRWVGFGGTGFGCQVRPGQAPNTFSCLPEHEPDNRRRQAFALVLRHGLLDTLSVGGSYRGYFDTWGLVSHTFGVQLGWSLGPDSLITLRYRYYWQSGVDFYRAVYSTASSRGIFTTRDREQSPMQDQHAGIELEQKIALDDDRAKLAFRLSVGGDLYSYSAFVGLQQVTALEASFAVSLEK
jgi:hypothetical protein